MDAMMIMRTVARVHELNSEIKQSADAEIGERLDSIERESDKQFETGQMTFGAVLWSDVDNSQIGRQMSALREERTRLMCDLLITGAIKGTGLTFGGTTYA